MKIVYLANIRLPTEKAHGLQIMQMCEAFATAKAPEPIASPVALDLFVARRINSPEMRGVDPFTYYGVSRAFTIRRVPCLDLHPLSAGRFELLAFVVQSLTYTLAACLEMLFSKADMYYSRDPLTLLILSLFKRRKQLVYEAHQVYQSSRGKRLQRWLCGRVGLVVAVTGPLADQMRAAGSQRVIIAPDGYRAARFSGMPTQSVARSALALDPAAFIVGYVGRLHTMGMSKGVDVLIDALALLAKRGTLCSFLIVGGPEDWITRYRQQWATNGLDPDRFVPVGTVVAAEVPRYMAAADVLALPQPWTEHFALYTSPLRLFEYMAAGRPIVTTALPSTLEIVADDINALIVPPGDASAMADAFERLEQDRTLCHRLGQQAQADSALYAWDKRAAQILEAACNA
jgi:glycosyltransferase involved in cell wall biosynthesis